MATVCLMYMPPLGCEGWVFSKLPEIDYTCLICRVQADSRGKVMLPIAVAFFEPLCLLRRVESWHHSYSYSIAIRQMPQSHCSSEHILWYSICSLWHHKECLQLAGKYFVGWFCGCLSILKNINEPCRTSTVPYNICFYYAASNCAADVGQSHLCCTLLPQ